MSDDLVKRLRSWPVTPAQSDLWDAADRIEELEAKLATCEKYRDAYAECDRIGTQAVRDLEETAKELADKLAQAVWRLEQMRDDHIAYRHLSHFRRGAAVTLAKLKGQNDD